MNDSSSLVNTVDSIGQEVFGRIINPLIQIGFIIALVYFLYGVMKFIYTTKNGGEKSMKEGSSHLLWGTIGLTIMFTAVSLTYFIGNTGNKTFRGTSGTDGIGEVTGKLEIR